MTLRFRSDSVADHRERLLTILATLTCVRVSEVAPQQSSQNATFGSTTSPVWAFLALRHMCGLRANRTGKNDRIRKCHFPALRQSQGLSKSGTRSRAAA